MPDPWPLRTTATRGRWEIAGGPRNRGSSRGLRGDPKSRNRPAIRAHGRPLKAIDAPEAARLMLIAGDTAAAIAFLCGVPVHVSSLIQDDELVAESEADRSAVDALGTSWVYREHLVGGEIRAFGARNVDSQIVRALLPRRAGLRLYADALAAQTPVARYRELWRVLESAFGLRGPELVAALGDYKPVRQLELDARELEALLVLRGRASHAASGARFDDVRQVTEDILTHVERLSSLA